MQNRPSLAQLCVQTTTAMDCFTCLVGLKEERNEMDRAKADRGGHRLRDANSSDFNRPSSTQMSADAPLVLVDDDDKVEMFSSLTQSQCAIIFSSNAKYVTTSLRCVLN